MDNLYSSFYLYKKYEIIGDELIDLGITSIDADGTQEAVVKEECDPACGCPEPIYRWVQTEDTVCVGEEPAVQYRWTPSGWTCVGYDKYQNNIKEQSVDEGLTWTVAIPEEYSASTLIESQSTDCGYVPPTPASPKFTLTLSDSSIVTAACDSTSAITSAETSDYSLDIISATIGDCVTTIGDEAFGNCMTLTSVTIPNSVTTIGENAFNGCDLHEINLPNTLINLGDGAFKHCQYLQDVYIPVGYVPNECFSHCPNLEVVDFSPNTTTIGFGAFSSCYSLESIEIPSAIESINYEAFKNCENLASVYVHATTPPTLRNDSFDGTPIADGTGTIYVPCASVDTYKAASGWSTYASRIQGIPPCSQPTPAGAKFTLTLSDSSTVTAECDSTSAITSNEVSAYSASVTSAEIGECVTAIGDYAFKNCSGITNIYIPNSVTSIGGWAFYGCSGLTSITIPNSVTRIKYGAFSACTALASCTIGSGVTSIGGSAFDSCSSLTSIDIPDSVTSIDSQAFYGCSSLTSVTIGNSVTSIGSVAFRDCSGLTSVTVLATTPPTLGNYAFDGTPIADETGTIYVPAASLTDYQTAWSRYSSRIQAIP